MIFFDEKYISRLRELTSRDFVRLGFVSAVDLTGNAAGNINKIAPAVKVDIRDQKVWTSGWLQIITQKSDELGEDYSPPDIGAQAVLICPGGSPEYMFVAGFISGVPEEAGTSDTDRRNRKVITFGSSSDQKIVIEFNREAGNESYSITTPNGHTFVIADRINAQGIVLRTSGGHYVILRDDASENRVYVHHSGGTELILEEDGDWKANIVHDQVINVDNDQRLNILGNREAGIAGDDTISVAGSIEYTANALTVHGVKVVNLQSDQNVNVFTDAATLAGVHTALTNPVCCILGIPRGATKTTKVGA